VPRAAVIGLGSVGSMVFRELARRGWEVVGYERSTVGSDDAAGGGPSRLFRYLYGEGSAYVPLLLRSRLLWGDLESTARTQLFYGGGAITVGRPDIRWITEMRRCGDDFGLPYEVLDQAEAADRYPQLVVDDDEVAVLDTSGGIVLTRQSISAAVIDGVRRGGVVREHDPVLGIDEVTGGVTVRSASGAATYDTVVVAAGARSGGFIDDHVLIPHEVQCTMHLPERPGFDPFAFPPVMWIDPVGNNTYSSQPMPGGQQVKFFVDAPVPVSEVGLGGTPADEAFRMRAELELPTKLRGVRSSPIEGNTYYDGVTADGHSLVGRSARSERIVLCTGFSLHGFKTATGIGEYVAQNIAGDGDFSEYAFLRPDRFTGGSEALPSTVFAEPVLAD
jgi:sarcosine oxidase